MGSIRLFMAHIQRGLSRTAITSSIPLALLVVVGAILSFRSHAVLRQDRDMVVHTYQVIGAVRQESVRTGGIRELRGEVGPGIRRLTCSCGPEQRFQREG